MKKTVLMFAVAGLLVGLAQGCEASKHEGHDATTADTSTTDTTTSDAPADTGGSSMGGMDM